MKTKLILLLLTFSTVSLISQELTISGNIAFFGSEHQRILSKNLEIPELRVEDKIVLYDLEKSQIVKQLDDLVSEQISTIPEKGLIAFIASEIEHDANFGITIKQKGKSGLFIYDKDLKQKQYIEGVRKYSWSPDGNKIAYIKGYRVQEKTGFIPLGVYILDLASQRTSQIDDTAYDVYWARYDQNIYLQTWRGVFLYDAKIQAMKKVTLKGIYISPDGKYYFNPGYEAGGLKIYDGMGNKDITNSLIGDSLKFPSLRTWGMTNSDLVLGDLSLNNKVINVESRSEKARFKGFFLGFASSKNQALFINKNNESAGGNKLRLQTITINQ